MKGRTCSAALLSCLLVACDDGVIRAFQPRLDSTAGSGPTAPTSPRMIDDFEDGDGRAYEPLGWWYPVNDKTGIQGFGIEPVGSSGGSVYALRTHGSGFQAWGAAVGVNLIGDASPVSAFGYEELCFAARVEPGSASLIEVHLLRAGVHFTQELTLSESWARHCLRLVEFIGPEAAPLTPNELIALQFFFAPEAPFTFWLDDVELSL